MTKSEPLLTSFEVGLKLGKSARTIQRMADSGELPFVQKLPGPNGAYLFDPSEIDVQLALRADSEPTAAAS